MLRAIRGPVMHPGYLVIPGIPKGVCDALCDQGAREASVLPCEIRVLEDPCGGRVMV